MNKLLLFSVFALLFTLLSCTADESESTPKNKIEKVGKPTAEYNEGPGDKLAPPPPPAP